MSEPASTPVEEPRPRFVVPWGWGVALAAVVITLFSEGVLGPIVLMLGGLSPTRQRLEFVAIDYQFLVLGVIVSALVLILLRFHVDLRSLGFHFSGWGALAGGALIGLAAVIAGTIILEYVFNTFLPGYHLHGNTQQEFGGMPKHVSALQGGLLLLWIAVEAPLAEETLFRGIMYQGLRHFFGRWFSHAWAVFGGALISGLTFGLVHFEIHTFPILALVGIILAYVFQYTRSLYASALVHGLINATAVIAAFHIG